MTITAHSPKYNADGTIDLIVKFPWLDVEVPFCANPADVEPHSADLFNRAVSGEFGPIKPYVKPALTLVDFKRAHEAHLNTKARLRNYDTIHTAALRAGYPGPFHAEGVAYAQWMDACNFTGYQIMAEVQSGARPVFATVDAYIALMPELVLP